MASSAPAGRPRLSHARAGAEHGTTEDTPTEHASGEGSERDYGDAAASSGTQEERGPPAVERSPADAPPEATAVTDLVPLPDRSTINVGVSPCPTSLLVSRFGRPRDLVTAQCQAITSSFWEGRMATGEVGTFRVRGHHRAVALLGEAFTALRATDPDLHDRVGSSGMLCVRHVRGRLGVLSNHALGLALDVTIDGRTDIRGDDQVQRGLLRLHEVLAPFGVFWGAGVRPEDAIHFEVGAEVVHRWLEEGTF
ncbi:M15 family metallopeptidase [Actinotalea sp. Marseille-Q4924]|uniref:M15 family metallopeptidase n=1 Tax=Actinotalea sp. Marseille-Q4924 TaxID=2866571 RepID=UPI001CE43A09|nr:M15 family metallopeptidase [Actinotalea sp. Marseille-Q4924]